MRTLNVRRRSLKLIRYIVRSKFEESYSAVIFQEDWSTTVFPKQFIGGLTK